jgi:hypothetical protein
LIGYSSAFALGFVLKRAPGSAGAAALVGGPVLYGLRRKFTRIHFLIQVLIAFIGVALIMSAIIFTAPLKDPKKLPVRKNVDVKTEPIVNIIGALVMPGVDVF